MASNAPQTALTEQQYLRRKLQWLMLFRVLVALFFLGLAAAMHIQQADSFQTTPLIWLYVLAGGICGLTVLYAVLLRTMARMRVFAFSQITIDLALVTVLLYLTGGINSLFSFLYSIVILAASICLYLPGGMLAATISSALYTALILLQHGSIISPLTISALTATGYSDESIYFPIIVNVSAFYLVAVLSSFLAEQARKSRLQLQEKQIDIEKLELLHEHIVQNIPSGLMTLDQRGRIITFNSAAEAITGHPKDAVLLRNLHDLFPDLRTLIDEHRSRADGSTHARFEIRFTRRDGTARVLGFSFSPLKDAEGNELGTILIFQDLTEYQAMQEHIRRMDRLAAVGRLAAGIAHEIRNPLASISGSIQVLKKSLVLGDTDSRLMDIVLRESNNLNALIADFTQFARPERRERELLQVKPLIAEVFAMFRNSPECAPTIILNDHVPDGITLTVSRQQFRQVIWNLLINAAQALPASGGTITITARKREKGFLPHVKASGIRLDTEAPPEAWIEIRIEDTGCGIPEKDVDAIFDPFFTTKDNGTGLGLSIVHKIIQEHGGAIGVESAVGKGTTFVIHLPEGRLDTVPHTHHTSP